MIRGVFHHWVLIGLWQGLVLFVFLLVPFEVSANASLPPLLKQSKILACARTKPEAKVALSSMWAIEDTQHEFPDENMLGISESTLHAATLDIVLKSILGASERFPSLRNQVERTLLKWNYCEVFQDGVFYDLKSTSKGLDRYRSAEKSPENWDGFKSLGFLGDVENRFVPNILDLDQQTLRADYEWLFHKIFRKQCFPHPDTSELFDSTELRLKDVVFETAPDAVGEYPYQWDPECIYPRAAPALDSSVRIIILPVDVPELSAQLQLLPVAQLVPGLQTAVVLYEVPQLVPRLPTGVVILPVPLAVPTLESQVLLETMPVLVPELVTSLILEPVPVAVPVINSRLILEAVPVVVPVINSRLVLKAVPVKVPILKPRFMLESVPVAIPILSSRLMLKATSMKVPRLVTKVKINKPKYVPVKKKRVIKTAIKYIDNQGQSSTYGRQQVVQTAPVYRAQPVVQTFAAPQITTQPQIVMNKNASLIERLLGGISGAGNVLIVDKIQLTVNEYNGSVETAISSSDIGTTVTSTQMIPGLVQEILEALPITLRQKVITASNGNVKKTLPKAKAAKKTKVAKAKRVVAKPKAFKKPSLYRAVPKLQSLLIVSGIPKKRRPEPVKIRSKKTKTQSKRNTQSKKGNKSSSVFSYTPYPDGKNPTKKKSVKRLLLEYQQYERDRKLGRLPKRIRVKESDKKKAVYYEVEKLEDAYVRPDAELKDVPPPGTEIWIETSRVGGEFLTPALKTRVGDFKKYSEQSLMVPSLSTMIIQQISDAKIEGNSTGKSFEFSKDRLDDEIFEDTLVKKIGAIKNQLDQFFDNALTAEKTSDFPFSTERVSDKMFEKTLVSGTKTAILKSIKKNTEKSKSKKKTIGLAGNIYLKHKLKTSGSAVGGSINRKLIKGSYWFARVGWNYALEEAVDPFSYSWGLGYSDWHSGTFSAQLNNWGPIKPEEGLALEKAVASFGYSVKSEFLKKYKLSLSGAINVPIEGTSSIAGNLRWAPRENWYVNASVSQPLEGEGTPKWTYGFGYSDWRPNKVNLQYSNFGPNEIPYHNYKENGTWSLSYNWKF